MVYNYNPSNAVPHSHHQQQQHQQHNVTPHSVDARHTNAAVYSQPYPQHGGPTPTHPHHPHSHPQHQQAPRHQHHQQYTPGHYANPAYPPPSSAPNHNSYGQPSWNNADTQYYQHQHTQHNTGAPQNARQRSPQQYSRPPYGANNAYHHPNANVPPVGYVPSPTAPHSTSSWHQADQHMVNDSSQSGSTGYKGNQHHVNRRRGTSNHTNHFNAPHVQAHTPPIPNAPNYATNPGPAPASTENVYHYPPPPPPPPSTHVSTYQQGHDFQQRGGARPQRGGRGGRGAMSGGDRGGRSYSNNGTVAGFGNRKPNHFNAQNKKTMSSGPGHHVASSEASSRGGVTSYNSQYHHQSRGAYRGGIQKHTHTHHHNLPNATKPFHINNNKNNARKNKKKKVNTLGLTPGATEEAVSDSETKSDDGDEETLLSEQIGKEIEISDISAYVEARKARFPTKARVMEKKAAEEAALLEKRADELRKQLQKVESTLKRKRDVNDEEANGEVSGHNSSDEEPDEETSKDAATSKTTSASEKAPAEYCKYYSTGGNCGKKGKCRFIHDDEVRRRNILEKEANNGRITIMQRLILNDQDQEDLAVLKSIQFLRESGILAANGIGSGLVVPTTTSTDDAMEQDEPATQTSSTSENIKTDEPSDALGARSTPNPGEAEVSNAPSITLATSNSLPQKPPAVAPSISMKRYQGW